MEPALVDAYNACWITSPYDLNFWEGRDEIQPWVGSARSFTKGSPGSSTRDRDRESANRRAEDRWFSGLEMLNSRRGEGPGLVLSP